MNAKKAKKLRKILRGQHMPESVLMIHRKTGVVVLGHGERAAYQRIKHNVTKRPSERAGVAQ